MNVTIRPETPTDYKAIRDVNLPTFGQEAEGGLVDALRDGGYVRLSLVSGIKLNGQRQMRLRFGWVCFTMAKASDSPTTFTNPKGIQ